MIGLVPAEKLVDYVGQEIGSSDWFEVDQDRIDMFADATLDHQFIHVDTEKATPLFGSTIASIRITLVIMKKISCPRTMIRRLFGSLLSSIRPRSFTQRMLMAS